MNIPLRSIQNIRDLGGMVMTDRRVIRPGCLLRSAHLGNAVPEEIDLLRQQHRLHTVIDLRTMQERSEAPDHTTGLTYVPIPIFETFQAGITHEQSQGLQALPDMCDLYRYMVTDSNARQHFRSVLNFIISFDYSQGAVLWHCTEGKDRCGLVTAMVLAALGADEDVIMADYLETNTTNRPKAEAIYQRLRQKEGEDVARKVYQIYMADERYLQAAWDAMGDNYLEKLGFGADDIRTFREKVLVSSEEYQALQHEMTRMCELRTAELDSETIEERQTHDQVMMDIRDTISAACGTHQSSVNDPIL